MLIPLLALASLAQAQPEPSKADDVKSAPAPITGSTRNEQVSVSASPMKRAVKPGGEQLIALVFDMKPGWHIYWDGQNDTGQPPTITASRAPEGFTVGPIRWPLPTRHVAPGDILDYIYEGRMAIFVPVQVPKTAKSGQTVRVELDLTWLQCERVCLPGKGSVAAEFLVTDNPSRYPDGMPAPQDPRYHSMWAIAGPAKPDSPFKASFDGTTLKITTSQPGELEFMPASGSAPVVDLLHHGPTNDSSLSLTLKPDGKQTHAIGILRLKPLRKSNNDVQDPDIAEWIDLAPSNETHTPDKPTESTSVPPTSR